MCAICGQAVHGWQPVVKVDWIDELTAVVQTRKSKHVAVYDALSHELCAARLLLLDTELLHERGCVIAARNFQCAVERSGIRIGAEL
ncbi:hypothetical protein A3709_20840 [Halioglobus sp. HI00S01]|nr:hypothetical protein A3709_20840 [Halioglobus sp. HI00S01]